MSRGTVLVVDDNDLVLSITCQVLEDAGFVAIPLTNAFSLTPSIQEHRPDLILLDVHMPALSGEQAASILGQRQFSRHIPILLHSELPESELETMARRVNAAGYVRKKPMAEGLLAAVEAWTATPA